MFACIQLEMFGKKQHIFNSLFEIATKKETNKGVHVCMCVCMWLHLSVFL